MGVDLSTRTPDPSDAVRAVIDSVLLDHYVAMPAKVVTYDSSTQYADVKIQLLQGYLDGSTDAYPVIPNVPVKHQRSRNGACRIHMPLLPGDDVTLIFSSRSLDNWKKSGGMVSPNDPRKSHITDAYALIGGSSMADAFPVDDPTAIEVVNGDSTLQVFTNGKFRIKNSGTELIKELVELVDTLSTASTVAGGPFIGSVVSTLSDIKSKLQTLEKE